LLSKLLSFAVKLRLGTLATGLLIKNVYIKDNNKYMYVVFFKGNSAMGEFWESKTNICPFLTL